MADHANITPLVELKGITKTFGGIHALKNAECRIYPGEVVALIGGKWSRQINARQIDDGTLSPR